MSSQSTAWAPATAHRPRSLPSVPRAKTSGLPPESLCDHSTPGWDMLATRPDASTRSELATLASPRTGRASSHNTAAVTLAGEAPDDVDVVVAARRAPLADDGPPSPPPPLQAAATATARIAAPTRRTARTLSATG